MRVGLFGGSFDPVHLGHLHIARRAAEALALAQVRFIPARLQPLKSRGPRASSEDRIAMLRLAVEGIPDFVVDPRETARPGPSYTVDTLREIRAERPGDELFLMVGADAARDLPQWREADALPELVTIAILPRPGVPVPRLAAGAVVLDIPLADVSATAVRDAAGRGERIDRWVPAAVAAYIEAHGLYRTGA